jgi:ATP-dependent Clp protease ATP-binding subunit ClpB
LTEAIRRKPYSVILFDEIEKAHHDVFNILLQVLDDGRLTDNQGRMVSFKNTVVIMTSNLGAQHLLEGIDKKGELTEGARKQVLLDLRSNFRPEFLNRVDDVVVFKPLQLGEIKKIVGLLAEDLKKRLAERNVTLNISDEATTHIAETAYDPAYGARPLKRYLQHELETKLGRALIAGKIVEGSTVTIGANEKGLTIVT